MTTAPRGAMEGSSGLYDPSILFDLEDILMSESNDIQSHSLVHTPIKEEPEFDHEDVNRFDSHPAVTQLFSILNQIEKPNSILFYSSFSFSISCSCIITW